MMTVGVILLSVGVALVWSAIANLKLTDLLEEVLA